MDKKFGYFTKTQMAHEKRGQHQYSSQKYKLKPELEIKINSRNYISIRLTKLYKT